MSANHSSAAFSLYNAPISKLLLLGLIGSSVFFEYNINKKGKGGGGGNAGDTEGFRTSNLIRHQFVFGNISEMIIGCILIYMLRVLERVMGSSKYFIYLATSVTFSALIQIAAVVLFGRGRHASPFSMIFSLLVLYFKEIPAVVWFRYFRIPMNDKSMTYFLALQALVLFPINFISSMSGIASGLLYSSEAFESLFSGLRIPRRVVAFCSHYLLPFLQMPPSTPQQHHQQLQQRIQQLQMQQRVQQQRGQALVDNLFANVANGGGFGNFGNPQQTQQQQQRLFQQYLQPTEEDIQVLVSMGFSRENSIAALQRTGNLQDATNDLLG